MSPMTSGGLQQPQPEKIMTKSIPQYVHILIFLSNVFICAFLGLTVFRSLRIFPNSAIFL